MLLEHILGTECILTQGRAWQTTKMKVTSNIFRLLNALLPSEWTGITLLVKWTLYLSWTLSSHPVWLHSCPKNSVLHTAVLSLPQRLMDVKHCLRGMKDAAGQTVPSVCLWFCAKDFGKCSPSPEGCSTPMWMWVYILFWVFLDKLFFVLHWKTANIHFYE